MRSWRRTDSAYNTSISKACSPILVRRQKIRFTKGFALWRDTTRRKASWQCSWLLRGERACWIRREMVHGCCCREIVELGEGSVVSKLTRTSRLRHACLTSELRSDHEPATFAGPRSNIRASIIHAHISRGLPRHTLTHSTSLNLTSPSTSSCSALL